jgi:hypothetical protein
MHVGMHHHGTVIQAYALLHPCLRSHGSQVQGLQCHQPLPTSHLAGPSCLPREPQPRSHGQGSHVGRNASHAGSHGPAHGSHGLRCRGGWDSRHISRHPSEFGRGDSWLPGGW